MNWLPGYMLGRMGKEALEEENKRLRRELADKNYLDSCDENGEPASIRDINGRLIRNPKSKRDRVNRRRMKNNGRNLKFINIKSINIKLSFYIRISTLYRRFILYHSSTL